MSFHNVKLESSSTISIPASPGAFPPQDKHAALRRFTLWALHYGADFRQGLARTLSRYNGRHLTARYDGLRMLADSPRDYRRHIAPEAPPYQVVSPTATHRINRPLD